MKRKNDWAERFGAKRRATDRAILQECERLIEAEDRRAEEERRRIARAFGRPLDSAKH